MVSSLTILLFIPKKIIYLWNNWGIELLVLASFAFQTILAFNGSRRRHKPRGKLTLSVWFSYLLATKVATIVLGKLTEINIGRTEHNTKTELQALLAPLMLMQIANPDTITAYSIEDNQLGIRQVFSMVFQIVLMIYILVRSWTNSKTSFLYLSMSVAGIIKYGETSWALKSALNGNFGITVADFFKDNEVADLLKELPRGEDELPQARLILRAYYRFCCLKPHLENWLYYPPIDCDHESLYINDCRYEEVFKITDSELGFMYDALYTKAPVTYTRKGFALRLISFTSLIATICGLPVLFKDAFVYNISVGFTYYVFLASLSLEVYQILRLPFTDWAIIQLIRLNKTCPILWGFLKSLSLQSDRWKRWSNTIGQLNLIDFCLETKHRYCSRIWILQYWNLDMMLRKWLSIQRVNVLPRVKKLIVLELREIERIKGHEEFTERGKWTIERYEKQWKIERNKTQSTMERNETQWTIERNETQSTTERNEIQWTIERYETKSTIERNEAQLKRPVIEQLKRTVFDRAFDKSIFIWHITTNIFYHIPEYRENTTVDIEPIMNLSNYMMYLMVTRSHVLSTTTGHIIFDHSCVKLGKFTRTGSASKEDACRKLLNLSEDDIYGGNEGPPEQVTKAEKIVVGNWSLLKDIKELVNSLRSLTNEDRWRLIGSMWVEMLGYAASNCEMEYHSEHIRQGGEILTHVWILIAHNVSKYRDQDEESPAISH